MILSQPALRDAVASGEVAFDPPLEERQWGEASVDLRLGFSFTILDRSLTGITLSVAEGMQAIAKAGFWKTKDLSERDVHDKRESFTLDPNEFVLAMTYESITVPRNLIAMVEGRSTYARLGLSMHQTAPWIQPGWSGPIVLEIMNNGPLKIQLTPIIDRPCQLTFFQLTGELPNSMSYGSRSSDRYKDQQHPIDQG